MLWLPHKKCCKSFEVIKTRRIFALRKRLWRVGQSVKTPPFHGGMTGSTPVHATKEKEHFMCSFFAFLYPDEIKNARPYLIRYSSFFSSVIITLPPFMSIRFSLLKSLSVRINDSVAVPAIVARSSLLMLMTYCSFLLT
jgi:hypothetical protein